MSKWLQTAIGICTLTAAIFGAVIYFATADDLKQLEKRTVQTLEQFQKGIDKRVDQQQLDSLNIQKFRLREELRKNPKDPIVKEDYQAIKEQIVIIENQLREKQK
jgi:hypothetical protein